MLLFLLSLNRSHELFLSSPLKFLIMEINLPLKDHKVLTDLPHVQYFHSQAKGSLLEKTTTGWNKYKQACLKMLQESTVDTGKETSSTIKQRAK